MHVNDPPHSKFTRGEKCIFFHIVLVFVAILFMLIIFIIHLYVVNHTEKSAGNTRRSGNKDNVQDYPSIGVVYLDVTPIVTVCNSMLLRTKWSISPANCVVIRTHPELAFMLMRWRIDYGQDTIYTTKIKRSVPHPHFDKDTFSNNIGLFEHVDTIPLQQFLVNLDYVNLEHSSFNLRIITREKIEGSNKLLIYDASYIKRETCIEDLSVIGDVRSYEYCIIPKDKPTLVMLNKEVVGIYSWGERNTYRLPCVILNVTFYSEWIDTIVFYEIT
ncbi:transmembrane protease serine 12-like isoform X2 [Pieris brassicae]|uniref:transmembrane protease serine 12-like isoform X2 n=1 Tax=Pieris brassicae TaxID=7116 RepID=UPI001E661C83|nr:transmembrane protease serine 12-like isoform X2 [Pieris brassicae]